MWRQKKTNIWMKRELSFSNIKSKMLKKDSCEDVQQVTANTALQDGGECYNEDILGAVLLL